MKYYLILLSVILALAGSATAAEILNIEIQHDGIGVTEYAVFMDGEEICAGPGTTINCSVNVQPGVQYSFTALARNTEQQSGLSEPVAWVMPWPVPTTPVIIRIFQ